MYKVVLVDDEILIRQNIAKHIKWKDIGFELVSICENGREAIDILENRKIDLVLTDICMPYFDGLELAKYIYEGKNNTKVIIISGYDDFKYAKKAINYQVSSYVLKPVTSKELVSELVKIKKQLDDENRISINDKRIKSIDSSELTALKDEFLNKILEGKLTLSNIIEKQANFNMNFENKICCCSAIYFNNIDSNSNYIKKQQEKIEEFINSLNNPNIICFNNFNQEVIILFNYNKEDFLFSNIREDCLELKKEIYSKLDITISILRGKLIFEIQNLYESYESIQKMKKYLFLENMDNFLEFESYKKIISKQSEDIKWKKQIEELKFAIKHNIKNDIMDILENIVNECRKKWIKSNIIKIQFQKIIMDILDEINELEIQDDEFQLKTQEAIILLFECKRISGVKDIIKKVCIDAADIFSKNGENYCITQASLAVEYINENFSDCDLSLQNICDKLHISISYFSTIFKEYTGKTFIEALKAKRIDYAKELLSTTNIKGYKVAEKCGYRDSNYFSYVFKKEIGMTPKEYSKKYFK